MQIFSLSQILRKKFIGADDLRRDLSEIIEKFPENPDEIVITQHGTPKAVLIDLNTYLELTDIKEDIIQPGYIDSLYKELDKVKRGKGISHKDLLKKLELNV